MLQFAKGSPVSIVRRHGLENLVATGEVEERRVRAVSDWSIWTVWVHVGRIMWAG